MTSRVWVPATLKLEPNGSIMTGPTVLVIPPMCITPEGHIESIHHATTLLDSAGRATGPRTYDSKNSSSSASSATNLSPNMVRGQVTNHDPGPTFGDCGVGGGARSKHFIHYAPHPPPTRTQQPPLADLPPRASLTTHYILRPRHPEWFLRTDRGTPPRGSSVRGTPQAGGAG